MQCAKSSHTSTYLQPAPVIAQDLGYIVTANPEQIENLQKNFPGAKIRALNLPRNLFEISHVDRTALESSFPKQTLTPNVFMKENSAPSRWTAATWDSKALNTTSEVREALKTCRRFPTAPSLEVTSSLTPSTFTIQRGDRVTLRALAQAHIKVGGSVRIMWDMIPPPLSLQKLVTGFGEEQVITPDSLGHYKVGIFAQGDDFSCRLQRFDFLVTANPPLEGPAKLQMDPSLFSFSHVDEIQAKVAWSFLHQIHGQNSAGKNVTVAVLDTGINYNHAGLQQNLALKSGEPLEGTDDDQNGMIDDNLGWDFINADRFPFDDDGHGSHVAGLVASPLTGVAPDSKILPIKVLDAAGRTDLATFVAGIYYAIDNGAQIINASLGFDTPRGASPFDQIVMKPLPLVEALKAAAEKNILVIVAAGNGDKQTGEGFNIQERPVYPASLASDNQITVAATSLGELTSYSNFSDQLVDIAAPGGDQRQLVMSLTKQNPLGIDFVAQAGTSMAAPIVAGVAALMWGANPQLKPADIKTLLRSSGTPLTSLTGKTVTGQIVNADKAVRAALDLQLAH